MLHPVYSNNDPLIFGDFYYMPGVNKNYRGSPASFFFKRLSSLTRMKEIELYMGYEEEEKGKLVLSDSRVGHIIFPPTREGMILALRCLGDYSFNI